MSQEIIATVKFHGDIYDIKQVGIETKKIKPHYDFNGYWNNGGTRKEIRYGMYKDGKLVYRIGGHNGKQVIDPTTTSRFLGSISFNPPPGSYQFIEDK